MRFPSMKQIGIDSSNPYNSKARANAAPMIAPKAATIRKKIRIFIALFLTIAENSLGKRLQRLLFIFSIRVLQLRDFS